MSAAEAARRAFAATTARIEAEAVRAAEDAARAIEDAGAGPQPRPAVLVGAAVACERAARRLRERARRGDAP